mgnify:CR=1 FL=1
MARPLVRIIGAAAFVTGLSLAVYAPGSAHAQEQEQEQALSARSVTWSCTGEPCPWGSSTSGHALVWPADLGAEQSRLGYTTSAAIYLPGMRANGMSLKLTDGAANVYAGRLDASSHRVIAVLRRGEAFTIAGLDLDAGEVVSVQSNAGFELTLSANGSPYPVGKIIPSIHAFWRCTTRGCTDPDWLGEVISWPWWAAYQTNARSSWNSRAVFDADGNPLYPYMGKWAEGCKVTTHSGLVVIIEWERGKDEWRETRVLPGQTHTIHLEPGEDNAMIETADGEPGFSVSLKDFDPKPLP